MSDILERVRKIVIEHLDADPEKVTEKASFIDDLGADSLDNVELVMAFEEEFDIEIPDDAAEHIQTGRRRREVHRRAPGALKTRRSRHLEERRLLQVRVADRGGRRLGPVSARGGLRKRVGRVDPIRGSRSGLQHASRRRYRSGSGHAAGLGRGHELAGASWPASPGASRITAFDPDGLCLSGGLRGSARRWTRRRRPGCRRAPFDPDQSCRPKDQRRVDDFILYGIAAADEAVTRFRLGAPDRRGHAQRTGVIIGSGIGGLATIERDLARAARARARARSAPSSSRRP